MAPGHPAGHAAVDVAPAADRVGRVEVDEGRLLQEADGQVELFRDALRRHVAGQANRSEVNKASIEQYLRRHVAVARPHDVLDVQTVVLLLVAVPHADLAGKGGGKST